MIATLTPEHSDKPTHKTGKGTGPKIRKEEHKIRIYRKDTEKIHTGASASRT